MKKHLLPVIVIVIILAATGYLFSRLYYYEHIKYEKSLKRTLEQQTVSLSNSIWYLFNDYISDVNLMASIVGYRNAAPTEKELAFLYNNTTKPQIGLINIFFLNRSGVITSVYPEKYSKAKGISLAFRDYFKRANEENKIILSKPLKNFGPKDLEYQYSSFVIISPVKNPEGSVFGFLAIDLDIHSLENLLYFNAVSGHPNNTNISFFVLHSWEDEIAYTPASSDFTDQFWKSKELQGFLYNFANKGKNTYATSAFVSGERMFLCATHLEILGEDLAVVAALPYKRTANYSADFSRKVTLLTGYIIIMLFLVAVFIIYNEILVKKLKRRISNLEIIIDENAKERELDGIFESEFYKKIKDKAKSLKE